MLWEADNRPNRSDGPTRWDRLMVLLGWMVIIGGAGYWLVRWAR